MDARAEVFAAVIAAWRDHRVRFAILNGVDGWPRDIGRDVDVLVHRLDLEPAHLHVGRAMAALGWDFVSPNGPWGCRTVGFRDGRSVEVHLITNLSWRWLTLAAEPHPVLGANGLETDFWGSFAKRVLMPVLAGDVARLRLLSQPDRREFALSENELRVVADGLDRVFGAGAAEESLAHIVGRNVNALRDAVRDRARAVLRAGLLRSPGVALSGMVAFAYRRLARYWQRSGLVVVFSTDINDHFDVIDEAAGRFDIMTGTVVLSLAGSPSIDARSRLHDNGPPRWLARLVDSLACARAVALHAVPLLRFVSRQRVVLVRVDGPSVAALSTSRCAGVWRHVDVVVAPTELEKRSVLTAQRGDRWPTVVALAHAHDRETTVRSLHHAFVEAYLRRYRKQ